ncbi:spore germination protein [Peribacillus sp. B-H-3]|uniref:spore germination protein n=1 Tax=Peribacillus sp. B-H-3 TaxID=3400420 RepID=UPI003B02BD9F
MCNMPIQIINVGGSATVQFGNSINNSPKTTSKYFHGSGSNNSGGFITNNNLSSITNGVNSSVVDQPSAC